MAPSHCQAPSCPESYYLKRFPIKLNSKGIFQRKGKRNSEGACTIAISSPGRAGAAGSPLLEQPENAEIYFISLLSL